MRKAKQLTRNDQRALVLAREHNAPSEWHDAYDLLGYTIRRPEYVCNRLVDQGHLERRIKPETLRLAQIGGATLLEFEYRLPPAATDAAIT